MALDDDSLTLAPADGHVCESKPGNYNYTSECLDFELDEFWLIAQQDVCV